MRILMLGWEFPPFISGGLGTACYGLTRALDAQGHEVVFVLPRAVDRAHSSHIRLVSPAGAHAPAPSAASGAEGFGALPDAAPAHANPASARVAAGDFRGVEFRAVPSNITSPYPGGSPSADIGAIGDAGRRELFGEPGAGASDIEALRAAGIDVPADLAAVHDPHAAAPIRAAGADYGGDVIGDSQRYARMALALCRRERFDVIHAHDWMTYPAGLALARATGRPLVAHIHSTEFDRSGAHVNQPVYDIERRGMHGAMYVVAVSELTRRICIHRYGVAPEKVKVVYNGVESDEHQPLPEMTVDAKDKIVLFLGRITMQKGPEYFIAAAKRVLEKMENVKFIVAGSGDMARRMIELAAEMGIGHRVLFTGFLRGDDVRRVFKMADLYVMPSVSEPFGIAPLEALSNDTPVIISRQSGVSEVLTHALKVDFWDVDDMANKIIAVLRHPPLSQTLREHGAFEVRKLTWEGAATKCERIYQSAIESMRERAMV